ncbi:MAG: hypothetical protein PHX20_04880 [Candidatus Omnitrophica bacterium]|nr:hypothetical protein [Candidatus Omnitrophota bacterium]MDD5436861.1 hypothetical protein [Candidatus Omnitrophota bacterium]
MSPRHIRVVKGARYYNPSMETFIERVRKARALGCNLSYLGIDSQVSRKMTTNRISALTK